MSTYADKCRHSWWCHQMKTLSVLLALRVRNSPVTGEFPSQRQVTWKFDVFLDLSLNKRLSKNQDAGDLRRHRAHHDVTVMLITYVSTHFIWTSFRCRHPSTRRNVSAPANRSTHLLTCPDIYDTVDTGESFGLYFGTDIPLNTWRNNNFVITSKRRHFDVKMTPFWRNDDAIIAYCVCKDLSRTGTCRHLRTTDRHLLTCAYTFDTYSPIHRMPGAHASHPFWLPALWACWLLC